MAVIERFGGCCHGHDAADQRSSSGAGRQEEDKKQNKNCNKTSPDAPGVQDSQASPGWNKVIKDGDTVYRQQTDKLYYEVKIVGFHGDGNEYVPISNHKCYIVSKDDQGII